MAELKSEIPSDNELHDYFMAHVQQSPLSWIAMKGAKNREESSTDGWEMIVAELSRLGCDKFLIIASDSILRSLHRLNKFSRTNAFWHNTNNRPTIHKLSAFCELILSTNAADPLALWTLGSLEVRWGSNDFGQEYWKRLHGQGSFDISLAVYAALVGEINVGEMGGNLAAFLKETGTVEEAVLLLEKFQRSKSKRIVEWSRRVINAL